MGNSSRAERPPQGASRSPTAHALSADPADDLRKDLLEAVAAARRAGISINPPTQNRDPARRNKAPRADLRDENGRATWKPLQVRTADDELVEKWYGQKGKCTGLGLICGQVSGGLSAFDFDTPEGFDLFRARAHEWGLGDLVERLYAGCFDRSPSGGGHLFVYCDEPQATTKLAIRPEPTCAAPSAQKTLIETKAEGGYIIVGPTYGDVHPSGKPYVIESGSLETIGTVSADEYQALCDLARSFDERPWPKAEPADARASKAEDKGTRPGDDYLQKHSTLEALKDAGWAVEYEDGGEQYVRRPGKNKGVSGTVNYKGTGLFKAFTTSTPFDITKTYDAFGIYAQLNHQGDFSAAAKALRTLGYGRPAERNGHADGGHQLGVYSPPADEPPNVLAEPEAAFPSYPTTDLGNGERMVRRHGHLVRHCHGWKKWLHWDGSRWAVDETAAVARLAKKTVRSIYREAARADDDVARKSLGTWARKSEARDRVEAMMWAAAREEGIAIVPDQMDRDPWLLNARNCTIDLRTGKGRPHDQADLLTKVVPIDYDPGATCPLWEQTLRTFLGSDDVIGFVRRLFGYAITGVVRDQVLPVAWGEGANGKSTIFGTMMGVLGPDYSMKASTDLIVLKKNDSHPTEKASLFKKRLVVAIETQEGHDINETLIKELTGNDRVQARRMREDPWEFDPTHKLFLATNHRPQVRGQDHAIWRRIKLIPFTYTMPPDKDIKGFAETLRSEYPGILAWAVKACLEWQEKGLGEPDEVTKATEQYREEEDTLAPFFAEHCIMHSQARVRANAVYDRYRAWAEKSGFGPMSQKKFGPKVLTRDKSITKDVSNGTWYIGIGLRQDESSDDRFV